MNSRIYEMLPDLTSMQGMVFYPVVYSFLAYIFALFFKKLLQWALQEDSVIPARKKKEKKTTDIQEMYAKVKTELDGTSKKD